MSAIGTSLVKIGMSNNIEGRRRELQTGCPFTLIALWATPGGTRLEQRLHQCFADRRREGEWFDFSGLNAVTEIKKCARDPSRKPPVFDSSTDIVPVVKYLPSKHWILQHPKLCALIATVTALDITVKAVQKGAREPAEFYHLVQNARHTFLANPWGAAIWDVFWLPTWAAVVILPIVAILRIRKYFISWTTRVRQGEYDHIAANRLAGEHADQSIADRIITTTITAVSNAHDTGFKGVHVAELLTHFSPAEISTHNLDVGRLKAILQSANIPVAKQLNIRGKGNTYGVRYDDLTESLAKSPPMLMQQILVGKDEDSDPN